MSRQSRYAEVTVGYSVKIWARGCYDIQEAKSRGCEVPEGKGILYVIKDITHFYIAPIALMMHNYAVIQWAG